MSTAIPVNCWKCGRPIGNASTINGGRSFHVECDPVIGASAAAIADLEQRLASAERALHSNQGGEK